MTPLSCFDDFLDPGKLRQEVKIEWIARSQSRLQDPYALVARLELGRSEPPYVFAILERDLNLAARPLAFHYGIDINGRYPRVRPVLGHRELFAQIWSGGSHTASDDQHRLLNADHQLFVLYLLAGNGYPTVYLSIVAWAPQVTDFLNSHTAAVKPGRCKEDRLILGQELAR
jgi:hypothetical protein